VMGSETMRALSAVAPLRQVQLAAAGVPVGMIARDVAGRAGGAAQTVADQFAGSKPLAEAAKVEPTMKPQFIMRDGKIVRKDAAPGAAGPDIAGEARAGAAQPLRGPSGAPVSSVDPVDSLPNQQRMDILRRVMPEATVRNSVLSGDVNAAAADAQHAKFAMAGKPGAAELQNAIQSERTGLQSFAERTAKETGGTLGMDESSRIARARTIDAPIQGLRKWFDDKVGGLYKAADEKAGGQPVTMQGFGDALRDKSLQYNSDTVHLSPAIEAYAKKIGMVAEDGSISGTVKQAEMLRKELNKRWSKQNSGLVEALKDSIDQDVFSAAGADIYGKAREVFTLKKQTLENPNGIARMFDVDPRNPMNRAVPLEQLPDKVLSLSADQLAHVTEVLRKLPPELQPKGQQALAELRAHFVNKVADAGNSTKTVWNQKAVARLLDDNTATAADLFKEQPALIQRLKDLRDAGAITTAEDRSYPGAAAQFELGKARGVTSLVDKSVQFGPAFAAAHVPVAGPFLVPGAQALGERAVAGRIATRAAKDAEKRVTRLSDVGK